jgi:hypothetical protein
MDQSANSLQASRVSAWGTSAVGGERAPLFFVARGRPFVCFIQHRISAGDMLQVTFPAAAAFNCGKSSAGPHRRAGKRGGVALFRRLPFSKCGESVFSRAAWSAGRGGCSANPNNMIPGSLDGKIEHAQRCLEASAGLLIILKAQLEAAGRELQEVGSDLAQAVTRQSQTERVAMLPEQLVPICKLPGCRAADAHSRSIESS